MPIIEIPGYGSTSAKLMCEKLKIKSCKEADKLKKAKEEVGGCAAVHHSRLARCYPRGTFYPLRDGLSTKNHWINLSLIHI